MLSRLFIPKTLLDQGGIYARSLPDHPNQWTLQSYERHGLTGTLVGEPTEKDQFLYVDLKFTNAEFQSKLKDAFPNLQVLPDGSLRIETEAIFQAVADKCREQLSTLPSDRLLLKKTLKLRCRSPILSPRPLRANGPVSSFIAPVLKRSGEAAAP